MMVDCCVILLTLLFPPLGVLMMFGCGADLCINLCLTFLGYLPGHIHAFYLMVTRPNKPPRQSIYQQVPPSGPQSRPPHGYSYGPPQPYSPGPSQGYAPPPQSYPPAPQGYPPAPQTYKPSPNKNDSSFSSQQNPQQPPPPYK
ncbi:Peptide chain release factor 1, mitochondrial [Mucor velutinosus]|uniref:Peptide chain release factor 1, mitochondrial n=1 Tax=Mucor velutinosus TaxID=708070 RepID=A0AAN7DJJ9_9FUNG|nr:Peptide chain release factor 1, mitochondrial [Mucor velutinosus]